MYCNKLARESWDRSLLDQIIPAHRNLDLAATDRIDLNHFFMDGGLILTLKYRLLLETLIFDRYLHTRHRQLKIGQNSTLCR